MELNSTVVQWSVHTVQKQLTITLPPAAPLHLRSTLATRVSFQASVVAVNSLSVVKLDCKNVEVKKENKVESGADELYTQCGSASSAAFNMAGLFEVVEVAT